MNRDLLIEEKVLEKNPTSAALGCHAKALENM